MNFQYKFYLIALAMVTLFSCGKDADVSLDPIDDIPQPAEKVFATIYGIVTDEDFEALTDAEVQIEDVSLLTDANGYFTISTFMPENGAHIEVSKAGYHSTHGMVLPYLDTQVQVDIQLEAQSETGRDDANRQITIQGENYELDLAANSFTDNNSAYSGEVSVRTTSEDPTEENFNLRYPGSLQTLSQGERMIIQPYGLITVELVGQNGQSLNINQTASLSIEIPSALQSDAPDQVSLFSLNEETGLWIEEGEAVKVNNAYQAEVPHFSTWCFGLPFNVHILSGTVTRNSALYEGARMAKSYDNGDYRFTFNAADDGSYSTLALEGSDFDIQVLDNCEIDVYSKYISGLTEDTVEDLEFNRTLNSLTVSGQVYCGAVDNLVTGAYVLVDFEDRLLNEVVQVEADGEFEFLFEDCDDQSYSLIAFDPVNLVTSGDITLSGNQTGLQLDVCDEVFEGKVTIEIEGEASRTINGVMLEIGDIEPFPFPDGEGYYFTFTDVFADVAGSQGESVQYRIQVNMPVAGGTIDPPIGPPSDPSLITGAISNNAPFYYVIYPFNPVIIEEDAEKAIMEISADGIIERYENGTSTSLNAKITLEGIK